MTQVKLPTRPKLEFARNYRDKMGRGREIGMHGRVLNSLFDTLDLEPEIETTVWESLAPANAMTAIAEGALIRLACGERCFERYRAHFGLA
jgi:hypothetical protein